MVCLIVENLTCNPWTSEIVDYILLQWFLIEGCECWICYVKPPWPERKIDGQARRETLTAVDTVVRFFLKCKRCEFTKYIMYVQNKR